MKKALIIVILILGIVAVGANAQEKAPDPTILAAKFKKQLDILNKVTIDSSVFQSAAFKSLGDMKKLIPSEAKGRANPFAPL